MKKLFLTLCLLLGLVCAGNAQTLKFNANGKFKIVQFTDVHYIYNDPRSDVSIERINEVLDAEKPDLVIFTGDVIYGKPAEEGMRTVLNLVSKREIPFAVTFGNHDNEQGMTREQHPSQPDHYYRRHFGCYQFYSPLEIVGRKQGC